MYFPNKRDKQLDKYGGKAFPVDFFFTWRVVFGFVRRWRRHREEGCPLSESGMVER